MAWGTLELHSSKWSSFELWMPKRMYLYRPLKYYCVAWQLLLLNHTVLDPSDVLPFC